ncbi:MAG: amidohydrolase family protein [Candidatus Hodarchaeota archaeon]
MSANSSTTKIPQDIIDTHIHWFDFNAFKHRFRRTLRERGGETDNQLNHHIQTRTDLTEFEIPDEKENFGQRWVNEFDKAGVKTGGMLVDKISWSSFSKTMSEFKDRFFGIANINPLETSVINDLEEAVKVFNFSGIKLYPVMSQFHMYDDRVRPVIEKCAELGIGILIHFGVSIGINANMRYADPMTLQPVARDYPDLNFVIAHFGAGYFRETLMLLYQTNNVHLDTSGSNNWRKYQPVVLPVKNLIERAFDAGGADRVLFGTDSSFFPRGYRTNILEEQLQAAIELELSEKEISAVFGGNARRIFLHQ